MEDYYDYRQDIMTANEYAAALALDSLELLEQLNTQLNTSYIQIQSTQTN